MHDAGLGELAVLRCLAGEHLFGRCPYHAFWISSLIGMLLVIVVMALAPTQLAVLDALIPSLAERDVASP